MPRTADAYSVSVLLLIINSIEQDPPHRGGHRARILVEPDGEIREAMTVNSDHRVMRKSFLDVVSLPSSTGSWTGAPNCMHGCAGSSDQCGRPNQPSFPPQSWKSSIYTYIYVYIKEMTRWSCRMIRKLDDFSLLKRFYIGEKSINWKRIFLPWGRRI